MLTEKEIKFLRLALDKGAREGEVENAGNRSGNEKMPFGRYRGKIIKNIPKNYLIWELNNRSDMDSSLKRAIRRFLNEN